VYEENKRAVQGRCEQKMLESKPKLFGSVDQLIRKPAPSVIKKVLPIKDSRSTEVRKHREGEEDTAKQVSKVVRVVKMKITEGAVTKRKKLMVENMKRICSEHIAHGS
jgi:hypothetical protein